MILNNDIKSKNRKIKRSEYMQIHEVLNEILEMEHEKNILFCVEGKKDKESLMFLGICEEKILCISSLPLYKIVEKCKDKILIDFLDSDKEGKRIERELKKNNLFLESHLKMRLFALLHINKTEEIKRKLLKLEIF